MIAWAGFAAGALLLPATAISVIKTFLIPRGTRSWLNSVVSRSVRAGFRLITARIEDLGQRARILSVAAPAFLLCLLSTWLVCLFLGFALLFWPLVRDFPAALKMSGSSMFTLGFAVPAGPAESALVFLASISGLAVLAMLISYLPVLYAAYNRRETAVTMLEALAGAPPWGPELLARVAVISNVATLPSIYAQWTQWAADVSESHVNYRTLIYFRSPDPAAYWLLSLLAVLDGAAMHLALNPGSAPPEARPLLRVGYVALRRLAGNAGLLVPEDPRPDDPLELTEAEFRDAVEWVRGAGWETERDAAEAWPHFRGWRVNYERAAYQLARHLDAPPAMWSGQRGPHRPPPRPPRRPADRRPLTRPPEPRPADTGA